MRLPVLLALAVAFAGCSSTMQDVYDAKTTGRSAVYPVTPQKAREVTGDVLWNATREYPQVHLEKNFVCVKGGTGTDETLVGVWCEPQENPGRTRVTVVVRRSNGMQVATVMTEEQFHDEFAAAAGVKRLP